MTQGAGPGTYVVTFHGGPANGLTKSYERQPPKLIRYLGGVYLRQRPGSLDYMYQESIIEAFPESARTPRAPDAWADVRRAVNRKLPTALGRSQAFRRIARRRLRRWRKVG